MKKNISKLSKLRDATTGRLHSHLSNKILWYKKWHNFKFHHHVHVSLLVFYSVLIFISLFIVPSNIFASLTQSTNTFTSKAQFDQGTFSSTRSTNNLGGEVELQGISSLSNSGGGSWLYKKQININNSAGASGFTSYQAVLTVDTAVIIAQSKMQVDGDDIRFVNSDGSSELNYWLDTGINTSSTSIKVMIPSISAFENKVIYLVYGNSSATTSSNSSVFSITSYSQTTSYVPTGVSLPISNVKYSPDSNRGNQLLVGESADYPYDYHIVNDTNGSALYNLASPVGRGRGADWRDDGLKVAIGGGGGSSSVSAHTWNGSSWSAATVVAYPGTGYYDAYPFYSPNGQYLSVTWTYNGQTRIYRTSDNVLVRNLGNLYYAKFNSDNSRMATYLGTNIYLYNSSNADPAQWVSIGSVSKSFSTYEFSKNGNYLFVSVPSENKIYVYNTSDYSLYKTIDTPGKQPGNIRPSRTNNNIFLVSYNGLAQMATFDVSRTTPLISEFGTGVVATYGPVSFNYNDSKIATSLSSTNTTVYIFSGTYSSGNLSISYGSESGTYSTSGYYLTSDGANTIDLGWTGGWGSSIKNFEADVTVPSGASITFEARTSYDKSNWTSWASIGTAISSGVFQDNDNIDGLTVQDGNGNYRYIQVKATFSGNGSSTPVLSEFRIIYMSDISDPNNPTSVGAYNDSGMGVQINNNSWTNETTPYFNWTGYSDGIGESGIDCFYVYFGTDINADPQTAGLEISGDKCHSLANIDLSSVDTNPLTSATSGQIYYLRIDTKDIAGNIADMPNGVSIFTYKFDNTQPTNVTSISRDPVGYSSTNSFSFDWPDSGQENGASDDYSNICSYEYKRSTDPTWSQVSSSNVSGILAYQQGVNSFYVRSKDCAGNVSSTSIKIDYYYSSAAPSAPTNLLVDGLSYTQKNENSFTFTWDDPAQINGSSIIEFCYSVNITPREDIVTCTSNKTTGAIPAATIQGDNRFFVVAKNDLNNINYDNYAEILFGANTVAPSIPGNVNITDSSNRASSQWSLTTSWNASTGNVSHYNIYRSDDGTSWSSPIATTTSTGYFDSDNLSQNQVYYYRITAEDNAGSESAPSSIVFDTPTGKFTTPPNIVSGPTVSATAVGAVVTWSTDRASSSFVEYSTDESFNLSNGSLTPTTSHRVELSGLNPATTYKFRVQSLDEDRDYSPSTAYSSVLNFSTSQAPGISEVEVSEVGLYSAIVTWKTTSSATSAIKYGTTTSYGSVISDNSGSSVTTHTIKISNLNHSSTYNFKIYGTDIDNNYMESDNYVFTTLVFPKISNVRFEGLKNTATSTMKITWDSNVPLSSVVEFRETNGQAKESSSSKLVEKHEMIVSGLKDNTDYLMVVKGRDAYGNEAVSDINRVRTDFDTRPPETFNISVETSVIGSGLDAKVQAVVSWETDEASTSQVEYAIGITGDEYTYKSQEDTTLTTTHVVVVSDLKPATTYHFRVVSKDAAKNEGLSEDSYFLTEQASESILGLILRSIEKAFGWLFNF